MTTIQSKFIRQYQAAESNYENHILKGHGNDPNFRILQILDPCNAITEESLLRITGDNIKKLLIERNESENLFFVSIKFADEHFDKKICERLVCDVCDTLMTCGKYFLVEICHGAKQIVSVRYIVNADAKEELLNEQLTDFFESVDESLLLSRVNSSAFCNLKNVSSMSLSLHCIVIRLLRTCDLPCPEDVEKAILENLVRCSNIDCFRAFLDLPHIDDGQSIKHTALTTRAVHYKYRTGVTLLFFAANGDDNMLRLLIRLGADVYAENLFSETASDHTKGKNKNLLVLLENDAKFPCNFHQIYAKSFANCSDDSLQRIRKIYEERQKLHQAIVDKDEEFIASFEEKYPNLKFAYTFTDEPAVSRAATTTALIEASDKDDFTTYLYVLSKGFCVDVNELYFMTKAGKNRVGAIILNRLKIEQQSHVTFLSGKTFVSGVDTSKLRECKEKIARIYEKLNNFSELASILKVVEHSKALTVSVDFRNKSILNLDMSASNTMDGRTYHHLGRIYLSVADKNDVEIGGLIIHELTHFALHIIFNNNGCPYHQFDADTERKFKKIVNKVKKFRKSLPQVVNDVYVAYSESSWPKELIARVPQLISMELSCCDEMSELFQFYRDNVLPYMERLTRNPEDFFIKREVNQLNDFLRHADEIQEWNIELDRTCLDQAVYDGQNIKKIICAIPRLFLTDFHNEVVKKRLICTPLDGADMRKQSEKYIIFASIEDFVNHSTSTYIQRVWHLTSNITLVLNVEKLVDLKSTFQADFVEQLKIEDTSKNMIIFGPDQGAVDSIFTAHNQYFTLEYTWEHLKKSCRDVLLSKKINFQGALVPLNKLIDDDFLSIPMEKLVNGEEVIIAKSVDDYDEEIFVERRVKHLERECATSEILSITSKPITSFLLTSYPGSGQSFVLSRIASLLKGRNPHCWIAGVTVEQLTLASEDTRDVEHFAKHFVSTTSSSDCDFELSLFKRLYEKSEVIFLFDSFVDLSDDSVNQAISLIKMLSEKSQLLITVHADSPETIKLEDELSNKIILELQPLLRSDHVSCVTKIWQKELRIDPANESMFRSYASILIDFYGDFIAFPKLTATIANKYLTCVNEYVMLYSEEPFIPGNIYTNDGIIDIYDLHKHLYSEKIHRRHQQDATNDTARTVILGMNMFTAFEQFAEYCFEGNNLSLKPLYMYRNGADDLLRNGILTHNVELSRIGTGSYFFLSNYIVKSLESSFKLYGRLCNEILSRHMPSHYRLIKLIDGRMKDSILFCGIIDFSKSSFAQKYGSNFPKLKWDDVMYLLNENTILLLCFILKFPSTPLMECYDECSLFWEASAKGLRCVIEILWNISHAKFIKYLAQIDSHGCNPFQYAFMNFPRSDVDVIKDTTTVFELSEALRSQETFKTRLNKSTDEKYQNSTLNLYVCTILNSKTDDERKTLIYQYCRPPAIYNYKISSRHFDESIEGKWMAMTHLKFPITDWVVLTTKTIFENVIHIIFNEYNNHIVVKFYKWAETKIANVETFSTFVADTFVTFFWNCSSVRHGKDIVNFVREKINVEELLTQRGIKIFNEKFDNKIATYQSLFTKKEFEILLFHTPKDVGDDNKNLITQICSCGHDQSIYQTFAAIPLKEIIEQVEISVNLVYTLLWFLIGALDEQRHESVIKFITEFIGEQERELVSNALGIMTSEGSFFNLAFTKRDMFMVKLVWKIAKSYLNEEQFRCLLLDPYNVYPNLVGNVATNEFMDQPPCIQNTHCQTACFEFQSFKPGGAVLPEFAISLNDKNQIYIGRCKVLNSDGYFLCKITLHEPVPVEVVGFNGMQPLNDSLEILIGKGIAWTQHTNNDGQLYFQFTQKLVKRHNNNILLVDETCVGQYYLAYDDDAARRSEILNGFCYYQGRSLW